MADRDFAQLQATVKPDTGDRSGSHAIVLVAGILSVILVSFVGGYWLGDRQDHHLENAAAKAKLLAQIKRQKKELLALHQQASKAKESSDTVPTMEMGDLTFYTDLPKQPVKPEPLSQPAPTAGIPTSKPVTLFPSASSSKSASLSHTNGKARGTQSITRQEIKIKQAIKRKGTFYVQAGSSRDMKAVDIMRHKLQAMGLNAQIRRVHILGKGTWYRLLVGPYSTRDSADSARINLASKMNLKGIVIRDGG